MSTSSESLGTAKGKGSVVRDEKMLGVEVGRTVCVANPDPSHGHPLAFLRLSSSLAVAESFVPGQESRCSSDSGYG